MLDFVGNIKLFNKERLRYLLATLKSFEFVAKEVSVYLNIEQGKALIAPVTEFLSQTGFKKIHLVSRTGSYGQVYSELLSRCKNLFIMHLEEDHFCMANDISWIEKMIETAHQTRTEVIRGTFFRMHKEIYKNAVALFENDDFKVMRLNQKLFEEVSKPGEDFFMCNNVIFKRELAKRYWGRPIKTHRPHEFEIPGYRDDFRHSLMTLKQEFLRPIDDDHGIPASCCLHNPEKKWTDTYYSIDLEPYKLWIRKNETENKLKYAKAHVRDFIKYRGGQIKRAIKGSS